MSALQSCLSAERERKVFEKAERERERERSDFEKAERERERECKKKIERERERERKICERNHVCMIY